MLTFNLIMRWLHIFSVITAVGASVFMRLVLIPSLTGLPDEASALLLKNMSRRLRIVIHSAIAGIIISGLYNTHVLWKTSIAPYGIVYAVKISLALIIFVVAILLTSSSPKRAAFQANRKKWLAVNVILAVIIVALSSYLRVLHP
jgi:uncharacterized membrane protein